jgi:hypothetical protein
VLWIRIRIQGLDDQKNFTIKNCLKDLHKGRPS